VNPRAIKDALPFPYSSGGDMTTQSDTHKSETAEVTTEMAQPIIIDLGRKKSSQIKDLKEGEGELWDEILEVVEEAKEMLGPDVEGKVLMPLILIYEKRSTRRVERLLFPLADWDADDDDDDDDKEED
jgi:hypothetical protein